jgi:hypothetical protein
MTEHPEDLAPHYALAYLRYRAGEGPRPCPSHYDFGQDLPTDEVADEIRKRIDRHIATATRSPRLTPPAGRFIRVGL